MTSPLPPRGWYPNPEDARTERWWDGATWTAYTHKVPRNMSFGPTYTKSYWVGPNLAAGRARIFGLLGTFCLLATIVVSIVFGSQLAAFPGQTALFLALYAVSGALDGFAAGFAIAAIRRSRALGARGLAISNLIVGSIELLICFIAVVVFAIELALGMGDATFR